MNLQRLKFKLAVTLLCSLMPFWVTTAIAGPCEDQAKVSASGAKTTVVYSIAGKYSQPVIQAYGTCYFECVIGAIQDKIHTDQRKQGSSYHTELIVARLAPSLRLISLRLEEFLKGKRGPVTAENAAYFVDRGTPVDVFDLLQGMDIPLFQFSYRSPNDGVSQAMLGAYKILANSIKSNTPHLKITQEVHEFLSKTMETEFHQKYNSDRYYHINSIDVDESFRTVPLESKLKFAVDDSIPTLATYNADEDFSTENNHVARVAGYVWDGSKIVGIVIKDSHWNQPSGNYSEGTEVRMSLEEFRARGGKLYPLKIDGHFIDRKNAKPMPLVSS